jgi:hypothetical protein
MDFDFVRMLALRKNVCCHAEVRALLRSVNCSLQIIPPATHSASVSDAALQRSEEIAVFALAFLVLIPAGTLLLPLQLPVLRQTATKPPPDDHKPLSKDTNYSDKW